MSEETNDPNRATGTASREDGPAPMAAPAADEQSTSAPAASGKPAPAAPVTKSGGGWGIAIAILVILALIGAGAYLTREQWLPLIAPMIGETAEKAGSEPASSSTSLLTPTEPTPSAAEPQVAEQQLAEQLDSLADRVADIEDSIGQLKQSMDTLASETNTRDLAATVSVLADRVTKLERTTADVSQLQREFGELSAKAVALKEGFSGLNAMVLATNQLAQAVDDGVAFKRPLAAVKAIAGDDPDIAPTLAMLEPYADTGIPSFAALRALFPGVADAVARMAPTTGGEEWYHRALDKVISLVTIRTTGDTAARAGGVDAILAEAEEALAGGDLATAVSVMDRLEGTSAQPAAEWLQAARLRLEATAALAQLQENAATRLAQARG